MGGGPLSLGELSADALSAQLLETANAIHGARGRELRPLGWRLNSLADETMRRASAPGDTFEVIILRRLKAHENVRASVMHLALWDCRHPIETLRRAAETARVMRAMQGWPSPVTPLGASLDAWLLASAYTSVVAVWFVDRNAGRSLTRLAARLALRAIGLA